MSMDRKVFAEMTTQQMFQEVWDEFYEWEEEYCKQALASLAPAPINPSSSKSLSPSKTTQRQKQIHNYEYSKERYQFISFSGGRQGPTVVQQCPAPYRCQTTDPSPPYEACTYSHKSLFNADDDCDILPFMPFSDRPDFPAAEYLELFDRIGWDSNPKDPDLDIILAEVVRRLHFEHGLSFQEIDETECLPSPIIEEKDRAGLLQILKERDLLEWPGARSDLPLLPQSDQPPPRSLRRRVNGIHYLFCPNLNCLEPYCPTHLTLSGGVRPKFLISYDGDLLSKKDPPCGDNCYKVKKLSEDIIWDDASIDDVKFILETAANLSSCDLAVVCDRPCYEVYHQRQRFIPQNIGRRSNVDAGVNREAGCSDDSDDNESSSDGEERRPKFVDVLRQCPSGDTIPPSEICRHVGKCNATSDCVCYRKHLHCHRNCSCGRSCNRRPKGCKCKLINKKSCQTFKCPCYKAGRECDPELCLKCEASDADSMKCRNNSIQHGRRKAVEVKEGAFGLGLFLTEPAREGDLIGEYVGEIISVAMTDARAVVSRYLGRNYLFALNSQWTIDAMFVGNETRFINHASGNQANCRAAVREVNGDHRIGVFVDKKLIQPGEELFMNYGDEYFVSSGGTPRAGGVYARKKTSGAQP